MPTPTTNETAAHIRIVFNKPLLHDGLWAIKTQGGI